MFDLPSKCVFIDSAYDEADEADGWFGGRETAELLSTRESEHMAVSCCRTWRWTYKEGHCQYGFLLISVC